MPPTLRRIADELIHFLGIAWKLDCVRHGHRLLCVSQGHICVHCGKFWKVIDG